MFLVTELFEVAAKSFKVQRYLCGLELAKNSSGDKFFKNFEKSNF